MKSILISIKPEYVEKILNHSKTIEIRKTKPNIKLPCKVYIYCTNGYMLYDLINEDYLELKKNCTLDMTRKSNKYLSGTPPMLNRRVVAEFTLNKVEEYELELWDNETFESIGKVYYDEETREREVDVFASDEDIEKTEFVKSSQLSVNDLRKYLGTGFQTCYAWHIEDLKIYDNPKLLQEFFKPCDGCNKIGSSRCIDETSSDCRAKVITRPPQSYMFVECLEEE